MGGFYRQQDPAEKAAIEAIARTLPDTGGSFRGSGGARYSRAKDIYAGQKRQAFAKNRQDVVNSDVKYLNSATPDQVEAYFNNLTDLKSGRPWRDYVDDSSVARQHLNSGYADKQPEHLDLVALYGGRRYGYTEKKQRAGETSTHFAGQLKNALSSDGEALRNKEAFDKGNERVSKDNRTIQRMSDIQHRANRPGGQLTSSQAREAQALGLLPRAKVDVFNSQTQQPQQQPEERSSIRKRVRNGY